MSVNVNDPNVEMNRSFFGGLVMLVFTIERNDKIDCLASIVLLYLHVRL